MAGQLTVELNKDKELKDTEFESEFEFEFEY